MEKSIIKPIVFTIVAATFCVIVAFITMTYVDGSIWCEARSSRIKVGLMKEYAFVPPHVSKSDRPNTYDVVYSRAELLSLCEKYDNHYSNKKSNDCHCGLCKCLNRYGENFFVNKALIIYQCVVSDWYTGQFAINYIRIEDETLFLSLYRLEEERQDGKTYTAHCTVNFIAVKKKDLENIKSIKVELGDILSEDLPMYKKKIKIVG